MKFLIIVCVLALSLGSCQGDSFDKEKYKKIFFSKISDLNDVLKSRNISLINYKPQQVSVFKIPDYLRKIDIAQVSVPDLGININPRSLELIGFQRDTSTGLFAPYEDNPKPNWSPEEAVKQAQFWYRSLTGNFPQNVGKPLVQFDPQINLSKNRVGLWNIIWPRIDAQGHQFAQDDIAVTLTEKFGVVGFANNFVSKYMEDQKIAITQDEAIKIGRPIALKMLASPMASTWSKGLALKENASAELWIVNPNHVLEMKSIDDAASSGDLTARLAWIVTYRASNEQQMGSDVYVWIDTETKKILGGDFK